MNTAEPPPTSDQRAIIKDLLKKNGKLAQGERWYLVSFKWYKLWKEYVSFDSEENGKTPTTSLNQAEPVDNSALVGAGFSDDGAAGGAAIKLRDGLLEDTDYSLVPESVWNMLHSWYDTSVALHFAYFSYI